MCLGRHSHTTSNRKFVIFSLFHSSSQDCFFTKVRIWPFPLLSKARYLLYLPRLQADPGSPLLHQCTMRSTCTVVPSIPPFRFEEGVLCCQSSGQSNNKGNKQNRTIRNISCGLTTKEISRCPGMFKENCIVVT